MFHKISITKSKFWKWSILTGFIIAIFAMMPQFDLWMTRGADWNGSFALTDLDEPFYSAYLGSLMEGKPRRNSPYSGVQDSLENPQNEAGLYIQFMASYPPALIGRSFNLSPQSVMIALPFVLGFFSAFCIFWLIYLFTEDEISAFALTLAVVLGGGMAAGQGSLFSIVTAKEVHYLQSLFVLRRFVPAMGFPALFLFPIFVWKFFNGKNTSTQLFWALLAITTFTYSLFSYFYFWTTSLAWYGVLLVLWGLFHFDDFKKNFLSFAGLGLGMFLVLIPFALMLTNRSADTDAATHLQITRDFDFLRIPEIISFFTAILFLLFKQFNWLDWKNKKVTFLLSFNLVIPIVFNQQVITGRTIQPYHFEFFTANYFALISLFVLLFLVLIEKVTDSNFKRLLLYVSILPIIIGGFDNIYGAAGLRDTNVWRDEFVPVGKRIKELSQFDPKQHSIPVILSFDLSETKHFNGIDIPEVSSQPILWGPHLNLLPDISAKENQYRLMKFLYYQNVGKENLRSFLWAKNKYVSLGFFGGERMSDIYTGKVIPIKNEEIDMILKDYENFSNNFSLTDAKTNPISMVVINNTVANDFSKLDLWYQRDQGEIIGDYTLFKVKLRDEK